MRIEISVKGIDEDGVVKDIENAIRSAVEDIVWPGAWRATVAPSRVSGRWDLSVVGPGRRYMMSLAVPGTLLATLIPLRLQLSLEYPPPLVLDAPGQEWNDSVKRSA